MFKMEQQCKCVYCYWIVSYIREEVVFISIVIYAISCVLSSFTSKKMSSLLC
ncbi:hypothetical protein HanRHA438_Chr09g0387181 [Helianthus annuus]|nr:hypothetical protein HanHA89_Chr09g0328921 [Helianthus annuus]KAJ0706560.1 hypothetical protein HanLR1_Chr09g0308381 [Helianthus annuus]KAJ0887126.1 hypothetical protein HanRHA438_Chr09g0387181 [Helianthus annuus]